KAAHLPVHETERESDRGIAGYLLPRNFEFINRPLIVSKRIFRLPAQDAHPSGVRIERLETIEDRESLLELFGFKIGALEKIKRGEVTRIQYGRLFEVGTRAQEIVSSHQRSRM